MNLALQPQAYARCLAAFIERDQLRDELAGTRAELAAARAEIARLTEPEPGEPPEAPTS